jgi:hypothetical protein
MLGHNSPKIPGPGHLPYATLVLEIIPEAIMTKFLLWCILLVLSWPLALLALLLYPFIWMLLLPFRLVGLTVNGLLALLRALFLLPTRLLGARV